MRAWLFSPNWASAYAETYAFWTEVIVSSSGREQRRAWEHAVRRKVSYAMLRRGADQRTLRRFLDDRVTPTLFPDEVRRARIGEIVSDAVVALTAPAPSWLTPGVRVMFHGSPRTVRTVIDVDGAEVTLDAPVETTPGARVTPAFLATLDPDIRSTLVTDDVVTPQIRLQVEPGDGQVPAGVAPRTFNGREFFDRRPNWARSPEGDSSDPTEWVDFGFGARTPWRPIGFTTDILRFTHLVRGAEELNRVLGLFLRCQGRRGEFHTPTWANDIALMESVSSGGSVFTVAGHDFHDTYHADTVRRAFAVRTSRSEILPFRIASMSKSASGVPRTFISTTAPAPTAIPVTSVVSWAPVCRFATDEMTVNWITDLTAEIVVNLQTLEMLS